MHALDLLPLKSGAKFLSTHPDGAGSEAFLEIYGCDRDTLMADVNANLRLIKRVEHNGTKMDDWYRLQLDAEMVQKSRKGRPEGHDQNTLR